MRKAKDSQLADPEAEIAEDGTPLVSAPEERPTVNIIPKNRYYERKQGCYNCMNFENGQMADSHMRLRRQADMKSLLDRGATLEQAEATTNRVFNMIKTPGWGICLGNGGKADFIAATYLCDHWNGRVGVEGVYDKTPEELRDRIGEKVDKDRN